MVYVDRPTMNSKYVLLEVTDTVIPATDSNHSSVLVPAWLKWRCIYGQHLQLVSMSPCVATRYHKKHVITSNIIPWYCIAF